MTGVRVKALVWQNDMLFGGQPHAYADTPLGPWTVTAYDGRGGRWAYDDPSGDTSDMDWLTREEAQAAAQADYETRILAALEPQDAPAMAEELVALRAENARLREALTFYANPEVYRPHPHGPAFDRRDVSYVATAALTAEAKS